MQTWITTAKANGATVVLMTNPPAKLATINNTTQQAYRQVAKALALANDIPCMDLFSCSACLRTS